MMLRSKKIHNILFGNTGNVDLDGELSVRKFIRHPDGAELEWAGNDGVLLTLHKRILALESSIAKLTKKSCTK